MDLKRYRGEGGCAPRNNLIKTEEAPGNRFVIQEHQTVRFHFDFRLETKGADKKTTVLHSWIIPKNIPLEPEVKHLAIKVDNKPLNFLNLHEEVVKGEFGEGELKIWDKGRWGLMKGSIKKGIISFNLFGGIVKSRYTMQKLEDDEKKNQKNHWVIWKVVGYT
jgi:bifunctional non-homologous end joining protein LigD